MLTCVAVWLERGAEYPAQKDDRRKELWATVTIADSALVFGEEQPLAVEGKGLCTTGAIKSGKLA